MLIKYLITFILSGLPISECRGAIIYGLGNTLNPLIVFLLAIIGNIIIIPISFWLLRKARFRTLIFKLFKDRMHDKLERFKKKYALYEELALLFFVAVPLPVTGAFTGILISEILDLNRKKATRIIALGVIVAAIITFLLVNLGIYIIK